VDDTKSFGKRIIICKMSIKRVAKLPLRGVVELFPLSTLEKILNSN